MQPRRHEGAKTDNQKTPKPADPDEFEREMADVVRLEPDPRGRVRVKLPVNPPPAPASSAPRMRAENDDDFTNFAAPGVDRREIRKLKRGEYAPAARLDLHGQTAAEARASVKVFLERSRRQKHRCVCIVHGRGAHSAANTPILKLRVRGDLATQPAVLAYADAPSADGGPGAVYVLLRR